MFGRAWFRAKKLEALERIERIDARQQEILRDLGNIKEANDRLYQLIEGLRSPPRNFSRSMRGYGDGQH